MPKSPEKFHEGKSEEEKRREKIDTVIKEFAQKNFEFESLTDDESQDEKRREEMNSQELEDYKKKLQDIDIPEEFLTSMTKRLQELQKMRNEDYRRLDRYYVYSSSKLHDVLLLDAAKVNDREIILDLDDDYRLEGMYETKSRAEHVYDESQKHIGPRSE